MFTVRTDISALPDLSPKVLANHASAEAHACQRKQLLAGNLNPQAK